MDVARLSYSVEREKDKPGEGDDDDDDGARESSVRLFVLHNKQALETQPSEKKMMGK